MFSFLFGFIIKWLIHLLMTVGIVLYIASFVMGISRTVSPLKPIANLLGCLVIGAALFFQGEESYKQKIAADSAKLQVKLVQARAESGEKNTQIETKYLTKTKIVHEKGDDIIRVIQQNATQMDTECKITPETIAIHNNAALITGDKK